MTPRSTDQQLARRAARIISDSGYLAIATATPGAGPWSAQLQYAWFTAPLRLVMGSAVTARHTRDIAATGVAAASIATHPDSPRGLDGVQLAGDCLALSGTDLKSVISAFYRQMFTDPAEADANRLPLSQLDESGPQRLLEFRVRELWILDLDRWHAEGVSARRLVGLGAVENALQQHERGDRH